jgi:hypothetical protein
VHRRALIKGLLRVGAAAATTSLWLPPASTALALPERRIFLPPLGGWPVGMDWTHWGREDLIPPGEVDLRLVGYRPYVFDHLRPGDKIEVPGCMGNYHVVINALRFQPGWRRWELDIRAARAPYREGIALTAPLVGPYSVTSPHELNRVAELASSMYGQHR